MAVCLLLLLLPRVAVCLLMQLCGLLLLCCFLPQANAFIKPLQRHKESNTDTHICAY
jgi:hypothetical protein